MAKYKHQFWPHYWGISEDDTLMAKWQVLYSENMDLTSNSSFINLTRTPSSYMSAMTYETVSMFYDSRVWRLICDDNSSLYRNGNWTAVWTVETVLGYWVAADYLYMIDNKEDIWRIALSDVTQASWSTYLTETETSLPSSTVQNFHIIALEDVTYIWYEQNLYVITNSTWTIDSSSSYDFISDDIVWMTIISNTIKIYQADGRVLLWQGIGNTSPTEIVDLWVPINHVYQVANTDYAFSAWRLYLVNWYTLMDLIHGYYSDELNSDKIEIDRNAIFGSWQVMGYLNGVFYIAWNDSGLNLWDWTTTYWWASVLTFGKKKQVLPNALNVFNNYASTGYKYSDVYAIMIEQWRTSYNDIVYIAYKDTNGSYWVDKLTPSEWDYYPNQNAEWILIYWRFDSWLIDTDKKEAKVTIRADLQANDEIDLMYIDNTDDTGNNLVAIETITWPGNLFTRYINSDFLDKTFALRFRQDTTYKKRQSLKYYGLTLEYETIEQSNS